MKTHEAIHLVHAFPTFDVGGQQSRFLQLANEFGPAFRHTIVAMDNRFGAVERLLPHVTWQTLPLKARKGGLLINRSAFRKTLKELNPDMVLSYNWGAIEWAVANFPRVCPHVHVEGGFGPEETRTQLPRRVWARRVVLGWTGAPVVVVSRQLMDIARQQWRLPSRTTWFIPNGVEVSASAGGVVKSGTKSDAPCIGTVAGLRPEKNVARLVKAFAALRQRQAARLLVIGGGPLLEDLQRLANRLGVAADVEFTGYLKDPASRMNEFDLYALPSDTEQSPNAMLEAMAIGMPVVATRVGDVAAVLKHVSPENVCDIDDDAFTQALLGAFERRDEWPVWAQRGQDQIKREYSRDAMLSAWLAVWRNTKPLGSEMVSA